MKYLAILLCAVFSFSGVVAQKKDTCEIGVYISSLHDFDFSKKSFSADFWIWMDYKNDTLSFENVLDITNSKTEEFKHFFHEKKGGRNVVSEKCTAELMCDWDVTRFPFDQQTVCINIEDADHDTASLMYKADTMDSTIDSSFSSGEWSLTGFKISDKVHTYEKTHGNKVFYAKSAYPSLSVTIQLKRNNSWKLLFKMLTGAYVAFLISCLVFFVSSDHQDSRFGLCVGGLFAAIGNKYIVESIIPSSTTNTLMDHVHILTFGCILLIVVMIIVSLRLHDSGNQQKIKRSRLIDKWAFIGIVALYAIVNAVLIYQASH
jgi:hypothetical protein